MPRQRPKRVTPQITSECISGKIRDVPTYLAFLKRQASLRRFTVKVDGQNMNPQAAIDYIKAKFPWLS